MNCLRRNAFTLVELLVVITIISMLMALLLPAIQAAKESGRRTSCLNNQRQISIAMIGFESQFHSFPGYSNMIRRTDGSTVDASWVVPLLPWFERNDLHKKWKNPNAAASNRTVYIPFLICPSNPPLQTSKGATPLGYAVNAGKESPVCKAGASPPFPPNEEGPEDGVFHNLSSSIPEGRCRIKVSVDDLSARDGATNTVLFSEKVRISPNRTWTSLDEKMLGILWFPSGSSQLSINENMEQEHPRPSSRHGGGVVMAFCDAHARFVREDIDYLVYAQIMSPDSEKAGVDSGWSGLQNGIFDAAEL